MIHRQELQVLRVSASAVDTVRTAPQPIPGLLLTLIFLLYQWSAFPLQHRQVHGFPPPRAALQLDDTRGAIEYRPWPLLLGVPSR
jgi:hypothetical protein